MAITNSKIHMAWLRDVINNLTAMDADNDTWNLALYGDGATPDQTDTAVHNAYNGSGGAWVLANEKTATGWPAGGLALASPASGFLSNVWSFGSGVADKTGGSNDTISAVSGCLIFDNTIASPVAKQSMGHLYFGGNTNGVSGGTFTVHFSTSPPGLFQLTC